jgi:hypothetical protein
MLTPISLRDALGRLDLLLPEKAPTVAAALRAPVTERDLHLLRDAVAPIGLPDDLRELLSWHDGMAFDPPAWWPLMASGPLLSASDISDFYAFCCSDDMPEGWRASWLPIASDRSFSAAVETSGPATGLVIEASEPDEARPLAPSLTAMLHATCEVLESDLPEHLDRVADQDLHDERQRIVSEVYEVYEGYEWPEG